MNSGKLQKLILVAVLSLGAVFSTGVKATPVVIDFNAATPGSLLTGNYTEDGFLMELVTGHYSIASPNFPLEFNDGTPYLGLFIELYDVGEVVRFSSGGVFDLLSLDVLYSAPGTDPDPAAFSSDTQTLRSSAGGLMFLTTAGVQNFSGPSWSNLTWITLASTVGVAGPGFDNITFNVVPVPPALLLFGSGLLGLVGVARRKAG